MLLRILDRLEETSHRDADGGGDLLIFVAVVHRYASGVPALYPLMHQIHLSWAQELCIYMFVWMAKFGAAYGVRTGIHVGVDVLVNRLKAPARDGIILFGLLAGALFTGVIGTMGARSSMASTAPTRRRPTSSCRAGSSICDSARLLSDVLPLPAGGLEVRARAASCRITTRAMSRASRMCPPAGGVTR